MYDPQDVSFIYDCTWKKITIGIETRIFGNACFVQANYKNILIYNFASLNEFYFFAEYLCVFSHLIAFHDPELGNHLEGIGFIPDVSYINWHRESLINWTPLY